MTATNNTRPRDERGAAFIKVGLITAAHGIRGQVKIRSFAEPPEAIFSYKKLTDASGKRQFLLTPHGGNKALIASIEGVADRNAAERLKGTELYVPAEALPKKKKGEYYSHELIGLEARLEGGKPYGKVIGFYNFGAGDIIEIQLAGKTEMLPLTEKFIARIDTAMGYLLVTPPEYVEKRQLN